MTSRAQRIQYLVSHEEGFSRSRLPALYSDFRGLRSHNPEGYAANVAAWRRALASLVRHGLLPSHDRLVLSAGPVLLDALHSDRFGAPDALDAVLREVVQAHDLVPLPAYLTARENIYGHGRSWAAWAAGVPGSVLSWGLQQLGVGGGMGGPSTIPTQQYVVLANVEAAATAFVAHTAGLLSRFDRTWSVAHFKRLFGRPGAVLADDEDRGPVSLSAADLDVLLVYLSRDKGVAAYDGRVVTLLGEHDTGGGTVTEQDVAAAQLRELLDSLAHQTAVLGRRVTELDATARDAALNKNRVAALAALRLKKQTETALAARFATHAQLEAAANALAAAADHVQVVRAMDAGAGALRELQAQVGGAEGVEAVVDRLREQMDATDEISRILAEEAAVTADEGAIDAELAALEEEEAKKEEAKKEKPQPQKETAADTANTVDAAKDAAAETLRRLATVEPIPSTLPTPAEAEAVQAALEAETTASLRGLSLAEH